MAFFDQDSDIIRWSLQLLGMDPPFYSGYFGGEEFMPTDGCYHYVNDHCHVSESSDVENDEMIARTLQEEFSQLSATDDSLRTLVGGEFPRETTDVQDRLCTSTSNYCSDHECGREESDETNPSTSSSSPDRGDEHTHSPEFTNEYGVDEEVGKRLNQLVSVPHVPRINGDIPSVDEATSDHGRLLNRLELFGFIEKKVQGDGNCQFRALSDQLYQTLDRHKHVRKRAVKQLKSHPVMYEGYVPMDYDDYLEKMSKNGEWGDHVTLQAAADAYSVKILVMTSFKDTCYIEILPIDKMPKRGETNSILLVFMLYVANNTTLADDLARLFSYFLEFLGRSSLQLDLF